MNDAPTHEWMNPERATMALYRMEEFADKTNTLGFLKGIYPQINAVTFDRTLFCPGSSEQLSDVGCVRVGKNRVRLNIENVFADETGKIFHSVDPKHHKRLLKLADNAATGDPVEINVNPNHRDAIAQAHSSEHLIANAVETLTDGRLYFESGGTLDERGYHKFIGEQIKNLEDLRLAIQKMISEIRGTSMPRNIVFSENGDRRVGFGDMNPTRCEGTHVPFANLTPRITVDNVHPLLQNGAKKLVVVSSTYRNQIQL